MKRYTFLMLAFFLVFVLVAGKVLAGINVAPDVKTAPLSNSANSGIKQNSARNIKELSDITESTTKAQQPSSQLPDLRLGTKTSSLNKVSCKTYEGKVFDEGEAGYNDCIKTIKNDRQGMKNIP